MGKNFNLHSLFIFLYLNIILAIIVYKNYCNTLIKNYKISKIISRLSPLTICIIYPYFHPPHPLRIPQCCSQQSWKKLY